MERPARNLPPPRLLPWRSWGEWRGVAAVLLGEPPVQDPPLLGDRVAVELRRWVARGRAPLAIHSTLQLRALLAQCSDSTEGSAEDALRLSLSMAIVRVVNGFTDSGQGGAYARSVYEVASRIGLPRPLVDLRHESSHGALPSLSLLRFCARLTLGWLLEAYWRRQSQHLLELVPLLHPSSLPPAGPDAPACVDDSAREEGGGVLPADCPSLPPCFDPALQQPLPSPPLRIRTSAARRLLAASGGGGRVAAAAGAAAEGASETPIPGGGFAFPAPVDFSAAVAAQQGDALAAYGMVAASWSLSSCVAPPAPLYAAARAVASLLAAQASSPAGSAAELRASFVVPLMSSRCPGAPHPSSGEGAAWRGGAPPLLLLEQCASADPGGPAETAVLGAWLPLLCLFQASWPVFGASLAAAAADVVLWGAEAALEPECSGPGAAGSSSCAGRTRLARAALRILELLSSSRWSEAAAAMHASEQQGLQQPQQPSGEAGSTVASSMQPAVGAWPRVTAQFTRQTPWQPAPPDALMGLPAPTPQAPPARRHGRDAAGPASWARPSRGGRGGHRRHGAEAAAAASTFSALCRLAHSLHVVAALCPLLDNCAGPGGAGLDEGAAAVAALRSDALALCSACGVRLAAVARSAALSVLLVSPPAAALVAGEEGGKGASLDASASGSSSGPAPASAGAARARGLPGSSSAPEVDTLAPAEADLLLLEGGDAGRASAGGALPEYSCDPSLAAMEALLGIRG